MIFSYAIITFLLEKVPFVLPIFPVIFINGAIIILFVLLFNNFFKISAHLAALGSLFMYLYMFSYRLQMDLLWWILGILLISGVVAVSRLVLNAHTKLQVYSGFFLGAFVTFGILKLLFVR
jgi:membrane-associated phospholipid phosphatase